MNEREERFTVANPFKFQTADILVERHDTPMFSVIEITTTSKCTRACSFCPRGQGWKDESGGFMTLEQVRTLTDELRQLDFRGNIILSGLGEPMSHPAWKEYARIITDGAWKNQLITNGDYLRSADQVRMFDRICVSLYDGPDQDEKFSKMLEGLDYELRRRYNQEFLQLSNRAGWMKWEPRAVMTDHPCNYPMYQLTMDHDGRVFLCCQDWSDTNLGNAFELGVWKVWTGPKMRSVREVLFKNRHLHPCSKCDVSGVMSGNQHKKRWEQLYAERSNPP